MKVVKKYTFDAAHYLPRYVGKCKQLHGHTYTLEVIIEGSVNPDTGMVVDFYDIDTVVKNEVMSLLDHKCLNDIIENPTSENVLMFVHEILRKRFCDYKVVLRLWETRSAYVEGCY